MLEQWGVAVWWLPIAMLPIAALLLAPQCGVRGRTLLALGFGAAALGLLADVLLLDHSFVTRVEVVNPYPRPPDGQLHRWVTAEVEAPVWRWHLVPAGLCLLVAGLLFLRRRRPPTPPPALWHGALVFWFAAAMRLGLEATAGPPGLVWAIGATPALLLIAPFFGYWRALRGDSFGRMLRACVWLGWLQRLPLVAFGWVASTWQLGTHLDTHRITELWSPFGPLVFGDDAGLGWVWLTFLPQLTWWVLATVVAGAVLGSVPWLLTRRAREQSVAA